MNIDLANLLKESLLLAGCSDKIMENFDDNSTIALEFYEQPELYLNLDRDKNRVIAWSPICDDNPNVISACSEQLFKLLLQGAEYSDSGQNNFLIMNGKTCVQCVFDNRYLVGPEEFLEALSSYFDFVCECIEIVK